MDIVDTLDGGIHPSTSRLLLVESNGWAAWLSMPRRTVLGVMGFVLSMFNGCDYLPGSCSGPRVYHQLPSQDSYRPLVGTCSNILESGA